MPSTELDASYWNGRYQANNTPWDMNRVSPPLKAYLDQLVNKDLRILIPGAGNGHEAVYALEIGLQEVYVLDWASSAIEDFKRRNPEFPENQLIVQDFFEHDAQYDLILEQTFFCALPPHMRADYVQKVADLLAPEGKLAGLLFDFPLTPEGPPFGGSFDEYTRLFTSAFTVAVLEQSYNSAPSRAGKELFVIMKKGR